jgi:uncharacterized protein (TIGR02266 family)
MDSLERRHSFRANVVIAVEVRDARGFSLHSSHDLSAGGVFFDRAIPHALGSKVELSFQLPGEERTIRCLGEVANVPNSKGYGMGIRFLGLAPADAARIEAFTRRIVEGA